MYRFDTLPLSACLFFVQLRLFHFAILYAAVGNAYRKACRPVTGGRLIFAGKRNQLITFSARPARAALWPRVTLTPRFSSPSAVPFRMPFCTAHSTAFSASPGTLAASLKWLRSTLTSEAGEPAATYSARRTYILVADLSPVARPRSAAHSRPA